MLRRYLHLFLTIYVAVMVASCAEKRVKYVIGVSQCSEDNWRDKLNGELMQGLYYHDNIELKIESADDNDRKQIEQIDSLVASGIDLLIVSPNQMNTITEAVDRAYDKGIPVILFDRKTNSGKYTAFIGADNYEVGKTLGRYVVSQFSGNDANIVEIQGLKDSSPTKERHRGFMDAIKGSPNIHVTASRYGGWLQEDARVQMDSVISKGGKIDCVFAHNDRMAVGARETVEKRGRLDNNITTTSIMYLGVDALASHGGGMEAVRDGKIAASYLYPTRGDLVLHLAMNILEGKPYKKDNYLRGTIVTKDNVEQMLMQNDEMVSQTEQLNRAHKKVDSYLAQYNHQKIYLLLVVIILVLVVLLFIYIYRMSAQKRRMAEEAADNKLQFFINVSHEFRTPLTLIADPVQRLLDDGSLTTRQRALLNTVNKNVNVVLRLVREILDFRKTQKGKMSLNLSTFSLNDRLQEWTEGFVLAMERHGIVFTIDVKDDVTMTADSDKIESIVYNLLSNAMKYTPAGGSICLSAMKASKGVVLKVADSGTGIAKDSLKKIFDRFYQAGNSKVGGTGIGLAVVKAFTELHGGRVEVDSVEGKGTVFMVAIPAIKEEKVESREKEEHLLLEERRTEGGSAVDIHKKTPSSSTFTDDDVDRPKVLVVDDSEDIRTYVADLLSSEYEVIKSADGQNGLDIAIKEVPDIILCDVMMPVMDGLEMCRRVKKENATSHIPVIMLTAKALEEQRAEGYDCGADAYLTKPFNSKVLFSRMRNLLENRRMLRERYSSDDVIDEKAVDADSQFVRVLKQKIKEGMTDSDFCVEVLSADMGLSRVQLYRKTKTIVGSSPVELIRIMRLQRASQLLKNGGKTVSEVAYEVGFSSPSYFTKCFKEHFGKLPGERG